MKKVVPFYLILLFILLFLISCIKRDKDDSEKAINLSESSINFEYSKSEKIITLTYTGSKGYFVEWIGEAWGEVTKVEVEPGEEEHFKVKVDKNSDIIARQATVIVSLRNGRLREFITVTQQNNLEPNISFEDAENIEFGSWGGEIELKVETNLEKWDVVGAEDWLNVYSDFKGKKLILRCSENTTSTPNIANISIGIVGVTADIIVSQKEALYYLLPYLDFNVTGDGLSKIITDFEQARQSIYLGYIETKNSYEYLTISSAFPEIWYHLATNNQMTEITMIASSDVVLNDGDFRSFLLEQGFEHLGGDNYWRATDKVVAKVEIATLKVHFTTQELRPTIN